jgi:hypothetical protein
MKIMYNRVTRRHTMNINQELVKHPCFHITDAEYLHAHGKDDQEILSKWNEQLREGKGPVIHTGSITLRAI